MVLGTDEDVFRRAEVGVGAEGMMPDLMVDMSSIVLSVSLQWWTRDILVGMVSDPDVDVESLLWLSQGRLFLVATEHLEVIQDWMEYFSQVPGLMEVWWLLKFVEMQVEKYNRHHPLKMLLSAEEFSHRLPDDMLYDFPNIELFMELLEEKLEAVDATE
jgi:hypothetical protein